MIRAAAPGVSPVRLGLAWGVHALTASGAVVAVLALLAAAGGRPQEAALWMLAALAIDSVDGTLARRARVKEVLPGIDGRRLDDIVDYLNYAVVPAVFLVWVGAVLAAAVFVPIKYVHASQMRRLALPTNLGATLWMLAMTAAIAWPERVGDWPLVELSLLYPAWYVGISLWLGGLRRRREAGGPAEGAGR